VAATTRRHGKQAAEFPLLAIAAATLVMVAPMIVGRARRWRDEVTRFARPAAIARARPLRAAPSRLLRKCHVCSAKWRRSGCLSAGVGVFAFGFR
jgi:hypothetical protein